MTRNLGFETRTRTGESATRLGGVPLAVRVPVLLRCVEEELRRRPSLRAGGRHHRAGGAGHGRRAHEPRAEVPRLTAAALARDRLVLRRPGAGHLGPAGADPGARPGSRGGAGAAPRPAPVGRVPPERSGEGFLVRRNNDDLWTCLAWDLRPPSASSPARTWRAGASTTTLCSPWASRTCARWSPCSGSTRRAGRARRLRARRPEPLRGQPRARLAQTTAVVWVPARHTVLVAPVGPTDDPRPWLDWLGPEAARAFRDGPGSVSPEAFWWRDGRLGDRVA